MNWTISVMTRQRQELHSGVVWLQLTQTGRSGEYGKQVRQPDYPLPARPGAPWSSGWRMKNSASAVARVAEISALSS